MPASRWLIVEDDEAIRMVVSAICEFCDAEPIELDSGFAAMNWITRLRSGEYTGPVPSVALLDIRMPGPQGHEVGAQLRQIPALKDMAIIMMTAYRMKPEEEQEVMQMAQADMLIMKPLPDLTDFERMVNQAIAARQARLAAAQAPAVAEAPQTEKKQEEEKKEEKKEEGPKEGEGRKEEEKKEPEKEEDKKPGSQATPPPKTVS